MAYGDYTSGTPATVPGSSEAALYNVPADMAAVVVKMSPQKGTQGTPGKPPRLDEKGGLLPALLPEEAGTPDSAEYKDWSSHELVTYDKALAKLGLMSGTDRSVWQKRMWDAGIYKKTQTYTPGEFDNESEAAWGEIINRAAKEQKSVTEVLDEGAASVAAAGGTDAYYKKARGSQREPLVTKLTSNVDIGVVANEVAQKRIGRFLTPDELARFSAVYHGQEAGYQQSDYNQGGVGGAGGTVTAPPSLENAAAAFATKEHPVEAGAQREVQLFEKVKEMFTRGVQGVDRTGI